MSLIILDRDGVINHDSDEYIKSPEEWTPIPGSLEAIARLHQAGYKVVVITNQSGIARGLFNMDTLHRIHLKMLEAVRRKGGEIDAIFFCPHAPTDGCRCRKPLPGLFEDVADRLKTNLTGVYVVGDSISDVLAARAVTASAVLVRTGKTAADVTQPELQGVPAFADLAAFTDSLLSGQLSRA